MGSPTPKYYFSLHEKVFRQPLPLKSARGLNTKFFVEHFLNLECFEMLKKQGTLFVVKIYMDGLFTYKLMIWWALNG